MFTARKTTRPRVLLPFLATWLLLLSVGTVMGQRVEFESRLIARGFQCLLEHESTVLGGLDGGGVVMWDRGDPDSHTRLYAGEFLAGNFITDMAWTGRYVWIASSDGGLTRVTNPGSRAEFRQYTSNLGSLNVSAVTGAIIGGSERVFYGMDGGGVGRIVDGISGNIYTADQDGLIDDHVTTLALFQGDLYVGTAVGISRFANNLFTDQNAGLGDLAIHDLTLDSDGNLVAGTGSGVYIWAPSSETWSRVGSLTLPVLRLNPREDVLWALARQVNGNGILARLDGEVWTSQAPPFPKCGAMYAGQEIWLGGVERAEGMDSENGLAWYGRLDAGNTFSTWQLEASLVANAEGLTFGADGRGWIGSRVANSLSALGPDGWTSLYEVATVENDSNGMFNHYANVLSMATGTDGSLYAGQYSSGVLKIDPETYTFEHITRWNSGLQGHFIVNMVAHPDGPIIFMHDQEDENNVEILIDPDNWLGPDNWITLPPGEGGLGTGPTVWDAVVERRDVIWFAAQGEGLVRWDLNGDFAGPDDPLTWHDFTDDRWDAPLADFEGSSNDPKLTEALALGPDGMLWAGGNGVTRFSYAPISREAEVTHDWQEKSSAFKTGLVSGSVQDLAVDGHGHVWVASWTGLNRIKVEGEEDTVDAWLDVGNYFANPTFGLLYSPNVLTNLPGGNYKKIVVDDNGRGLLLSSTRGAVHIEVGDLTATGSDPLAPLFLYPNPFHPDRGAGVLSLGGVISDPQRDPPVQVEIYNLDGQLVYRYSYALFEEGFWAGINRKGKKVATGMYVVKVSWQGRTAVRSLAVVR